METIVGLLAVLVAVVILSTAGVVVFIVKLTGGLLRGHGAYQYLMAVARQLDTVGGALLYGQQKMTLSAAAYRHRKYIESLIFVHVIDTLALPFEGWRFGHCKRAFQAWAEAARVD